MTKKFGLITLILCFALNLVADEPLDNDVVAHIKEEAYQYSQAYDTLSYLTDVHGPRLSGNPTYYDAVEWAKQRLEEWGLENVHIEPFGENMRGWDVESYRVEMTSPRYMNIVALPNAWSNSTDGVITGEPILANVRSLEELQEFSGQLRGKILMSSEITQPRPDREGIFTDEELAIADSHINPNNLDGLDNAGLGNYVERRRSRRNHRPQGGGIEQFFLDEGVAAVLHRSSKAPGILDATKMTAFNKTDRIKPVPHFSISSEQHGRMIRMIERGAKVTLKLHSNVKYYTNPEYYSNVIAEIPGTDRNLKDQLVMVGGHFDSNQGGTGAADNGAGSAVTMEVMRILKALDIKPRRTIRLVLWGGEEQGHLGSLAYLEKYVGDIYTGEDRGELNKISVYYNHDNNGHEIRGIHGQGNEPIRPIFRRYLEPFHAVGAKTASIENAGGTDHLGFDTLNIPAFEWIQDAHQYFNKQIHTNMDVLEFMAEDTLKHNAAIIATFVYHAAMRDEMMPRKTPIPY